MIELGLKIKNIPCFLLLVIIFTEQTYSYVIQTKNPNRIDKMVEDNQANIIAENITFHVKQPLLKENKQSSKAKDEIEQKQGTNEAIQGFFSINDNKYAKNIRILSQFEKMTKNSQTVENLTDNSILNNENNKQFGNEVSPPLAQTFANYNINKNYNFNNQIQTSKGASLNQSQNFSFQGFNFGNYQAVINQISSINTLQQSSNNGTISSISPEFQNQFSQVILNHEIPETFAEGQIFLFQGKVSQEQIYENNSNVVTVVFTDEYLLSRYIFTETLLAKGQTFRIQAQIPPAGRYKLAVFYGLNGSSSKNSYIVADSKELVEEINLLKNNLTLKSKQQKNKRYWIEFEVVSNDFFMVIHLNSSYSSLTPSSALTNAAGTGNAINGSIPKNGNSSSITSSYTVFIVKLKQYFSQQVQLIFSNFHLFANSGQSQSIKIPYYKFENFSQDFTTVQIYTAESKNLSALNLIPSTLTYVSIQQFFATYHQFSQLKTQILQLSAQPPFHLEQWGLKLNVAGTAKEQLRNEVVVLQPTKVFKEYQINSFLKIGQNISANSMLNLSFLIDKIGTYIIQINHVDGYAALNQPIYVGNKIYPLLPDYEDLNKNPIQQETFQKVNLQDIKLHILDLINKKRKQFRQGLLKLDPKLTNLAQTHANDMLMRNYVSHYTPEGKGPVERAKALQIFEEVSQNIALNKKIEDAHFRLCRSNIHLRNMVNPSWERLGLGLILNSDNAYIVVQEYSVRDLALYPLTKEQINTLKTSILNVLMPLSANLKKVNQTLSNDVTEYARLKNLNQTGQYANLGDYLKTTQRYNRWAFSNLKVTYKQDGFLQAISQQGSVLPKSDYYTQIGMSLEYSQGFLQMYFGFI